MTLTVNSQESASTGHSVAVGTNATGTLTWAFTNTSGDLVLVGVAVNARSPGTAQNQHSAITGVTYGGQTMQRVGGVSWWVVNTYNMSELTIWRLTSPPTGANDVIVSWQTSQTDTGSYGQVIGGAISFSGADQTTPCGTPISNSSVTGAPGDTLTLTGTTAGSYGFDVFEPAINAEAVVAGQTLTWRRDVNTNTGGGNQGASYKASSGGSLDMGWTIASDWFGHIAVEVKAAPITRTASPVSASIGSVTSQTAVPIANVANPGGWTDQTGSATDLWTPLTATDASYDQSPRTPTAAGFTVTLATLDAPGAGDRVLHVTTSKADATGGTVNLTVNLRDSAGTLIQAFSGGSLDNISATPTQIDLTVTNAIANYTGLRVEILATQA